MIDIVDDTTVQPRDNDLVTETDGNQVTHSRDEHCAIASEALADDIASLDAAVAKLNSEVLSLHRESEAQAKLDEITQAADIASLDAAVEQLNSQVLDLVWQTPQEDTRGTAYVTAGAIQKVENQYFDYSFYRESSASPPPHPLSTYRWEDIKREKEKVQRELTVNLNFTLLHTNTTHTQSAHIATVGR